MHALDPCGTSCWTIRRARTAAGAGARGLLFRVLLAVGLLLSPGARLTAEPVPKGASVDLVLVLDQSSTMRPMFEAVQDAFWRLMADALQADLDLDVRVGLVLYGRAPVDGGEASPTELHELTIDWDALTDTLRGAKTSGGREYLGRALRVARVRSGWRPDAVRAIVVIGNESPLQDPDHDAQEEAKRCKAAGIPVHALYCGKADDAAGPLWKELVETGGGRFETFDYRQRKLAVPTPFDRRVYTLVPRMLAAWVPRSGGSATGAPSRAPSSAPAPTDVPSSSVPSEGASPKNGSPPGGSPQGRAPEARSPSEVSAGSAADRALALALRGVPGIRGAPAQARDWPTHALPPALRTLAPDARARALGLRQRAFDDSRTALVALARERRAWRARQERATPEAQRAHARLGRLLGDALPGTARPGTTRPGTTR